jgi:HK97 family phage major capsid protein/HK97 family phage prohead protease
MRMSTHRAYSILEIKSIDEEKRVIEGIATTPSTDRVGDIVEPMGAQFSLPLPLLLHHDSTQPIGEVVSAKQTKDGIIIKAQIAQSSEPGTLKDRLDEAWQSVKIGLIRGLSIGFKALEVSDIKGTFGQRFTKWLWLELSAVTVPANQDASILAIKAIDTAGIAASGNDQQTVISAGVSASPQRRSAKPMTPTERRTAFEAKRQTTFEKMEALQAEADKRGESKNEQERDEFESLQKDLATIDREIEDAKVLEKVSAQRATAVVEAPQQRGLTIKDDAVIDVSDAKLPPGIGFTRSVMVELQARMENRDVVQLAKARYPSHTALHKFIEHKAVVPAGTSSQAVWAGPLVYTANLVSEFIEFLRPQTIIGRFGNNGIPSLTHTPFNVRVPSQTSGGNAYWVGEGAAKPLTSVAFSSVTLTHHKVATIAVLTKELVRLSTPSAELRVRTTLAEAVVARLDLDFIDPAHAASAGVSPASITNGLVALSSAGTSSDNVITDIGKILKAYIENNMTTSGLVLIMPASLAMVAGLMRNSLGQRVFPDLNMTGGTLEGIPVITTQYAANSSGGGNLVIAVHAPSILLADDGNVTVDASDQVSLQMSDAPTINSVTGTGASLVSMWQTNSLAVRAEREITWLKGRSEAVVYMDDVNWGSVGSPA